MTARRFGPIRLLLLVTLAGTAGLAAGCGADSAGPTSGPTAPVSPSAAASASASASLAASASASAGASPTLSLGLPHVDAALENRLPGTIGGVDLQKLSLPLSTYIASSKGGDKALLGPWAIHFGKTADEINVAVATDLTEQIDFFVQAIQVKGEKPDGLTGELTRLARQDGWPVTGRTVASRAVLEITDPVMEAAGGLATAYVLAVGDVMYVVVTDEPAYLVECLIKLPTEAGGSS
jgi:hypothetical protein